MVVAEANYGNWTTFTGTLAEVMGELTGKPYNSVVCIYWNSSTNLLVAICRAAMVV